MDEGMEEVCVVPMSDTAANMAPAWQTFLHVHAEELEPILSHCGVDEQEVLNISDSRTAMINGADWPDVTPESRLSRSLGDSGQRRAMLHFMEKYAQANPSVLLPSFLMLHVLYPSVSVKDHCTAMKTHTALTVERSGCVSLDSTIACCCDDTTSGIQAFDALVFVINRLLVPLASSKIPPQVEDGLWGRVWSSGFYMILSAFFTTHGDWRLTGRLLTETAGIYMQNLEMLMSQSVHVPFSTGGSFDPLMKNGKRNRQMPRCGEWGVDLFGDTIPGMPRVFQKLAMMANFSFPSDPHVGSLFLALCGPVVSRRQNVSSLIVTSSLAPNLFAIESL